MVTPFEPKTIRRYLNRVAQWLRFMPQKDRDELRRELRLHLQSMASMAQSAGASQDEAIQIALQRFGSADAVGRRLFISRLKESGVSDLVVLAGKPIQKWVKSTPTVDLYLLFLAFAFFLTLPFLPWMLALPHSAMIGILAGRLNAQRKVTFSPLVKWTHAGPFYWKQINWGFFLGQFLVVGFIVILLPKIILHSFLDVEIWICFQFAFLVSAISEAIIRNRAVRLLAISK